MAQADQLIRNGVNVSIATADHDGHHRGLYAGAAGTVYVDMVGEGTGVKWVMQAGQWLPIEYTKIYAENDGTYPTTASMEIVATNW